MITKDMIISDIINMDDKYADVLEECLMPCGGCPGADLETLEEAAKGHGIDLEELLKKLNA